MLLFQRCCERLSCFSDPLKPFTHQPSFLIPLTFIRTLHLHIETINCISQSSNQPLHRHSSSLPQPSFPLCLPTYLSISLLLYFTYTFFCFPYTFRLYQLIYLLVYLSISFTPHLSQTKLLYLSYKFLPSTSCLSFSLSIYLPISTLFQASLTQN